MSTRMSSGIWVLSNDLSIYPFILLFLLSIMPSYTILDLW